MCLCGAIFFHLFIVLFVACSRLNFAITIHRGSLFRLISSPDSYQDAFSHYRQLTQRAPLRFRLRRKAHRTMFSIPAVCLRAYNHIYVRSASGWIMARFIASKVVKFELFAILHANAIVFQYQHNLGDFNTFNWYVKINCLLLMA